MATNLFEMSRGGSDEHDGKVAGRGGRYGCQPRVEEQNGNGRDRLFSSQRRVHVQSTEVLSDGLQFLENGKALRPAQCPCVLRTRPRYYTKTAKLCSIFCNKLGICHSNIRATFLVKCQPMI